MARGFLGGFVVGAGLSVCAAAIVSVIAGPPVPPEIVNDAPVVADASDEDTAAPPARLPEAEPRQPSASDVSVPDPDDGRGMAAEALRPAARPAPSRVMSGVTEPAPSAATDDVVEGDTAPVRPGSQPALPGAPDTDSPAAIVTEPPRPGAAGVNAPGRLPGGEALDVPGSADRPAAPGADEPVAALADSTAPSAPGQPEGPDVSAETAPQPEATPPRVFSGPEAPTAPDSMVLGPQAMSGISARPTADTRAPDPAPGRESAAPQIDETPHEAGAGAGDTVGAEGTDPGEGRPMIGTPATSLLDRATPTADPAPQDDAAASDSGQSALVRNAEPFENPRDLPLLSIILMDHGEDLEDMPIGLAALDSFPYPLTFAVDVSLPDAAERAARYRADGIEVMALVDLPASFTASDTEVALPTLLDRIPAAAAVLEGREGGLQGSAEMSEQVAAILGETGHGIVWQPGTLGSAQRRAAREGVPAQTLDRIFDNEDETPLVIRRFLDQAAFRAGQEGSVIVAGRLRSDTITALVIWGLKDRERRVAVAPVSAALLAGQGGS